MRGATKNGLALSNERLSALPSIMGNQLGDPWRFVKKLLNFSKDGPNRIDFAEKKRGETVDSWEKWMHAWVTVLTFFLSLVALPVSRTIQKNGLAIFSSLN